MLPYPSSFYTRPDPSTPTGARVDLSKASLPSSRWGSRLDDSRFNRRDGFSTVATLLAHFPVRVDGSTLPDPEHTAASLNKSSPVQLIEMHSGRRIPVFAEVDANAGKGERQTLVIQAVERLRPKTRYVAVVQGLKTAEGAPVEALTGFKLLRDGVVPEGSALASQKTRFEEIFAALTRTGVDRKTLQLAWDFSTGSDEATVGRLVRMRDEAQDYAASAYRTAARVEPPKPIRVNQLLIHPRSKPGLWKRIVGTMAVPSYLEGGNANGNRLKLDDNGEPVINKFARFPLVIQVPECARYARGPLPVMIYGHGTFSTADREMGLEYSTGLTNKLCMIQVGTDWLGRARPDLEYFALRVLTNWSNFTQITDRLQQAHVNVAYLAHLLRSGELGKLEELQNEGTSLIDSSKIYYYGISEGGCQGVTALALSPDIDRGALNVPCGFWSMFFWRSSDFYHVRRALKLSYGDPMDQQKLVALSQLDWDYTDPANYAEHVLRNPLPGSTVKPVLYQEGINDASVPNVTTRAMVRTLGLKLLHPWVERVEGIGEARGPQQSAYVQYDVSVRPRLGLRNVPPPVSRVHEDIRRLGAVTSQLERFLRTDGRVEDTCDGQPCIFPRPASGAPLTGPAPASRQVP